MCISRQCKLYPGESKQQLRLWLPNPRVAHTSVGAAQMEQWWQAARGPTPDGGHAELAAPWRTLPNSVELRDILEQIQFALW
jgi:hypothetical protein